MATFFRYFFYFYIFYFILNKRKKWVFGHKGLQMALLSHFCVATFENKSGQKVAIWPQKAHFVHNLFTNGKKKVGMAKLKVATKWAKWPQKWPKTRKKERDCDLRAAPQISIYFQIRLVFRSLTVILPTNSKPASSHR